MTDEDQLADIVEREHKRRDRAAREKRSNLWTQITKVGTLGWVVALPIVGGALLGHFIDRRFGSGITWSLGLMFVGIVTGGYALWAELDKQRK